MAYSLVKQNGVPAYGVSEYIVDTKADIESLPISSTPGSTAFVVEDGTTYILSNKKEWSKIASSSNGGGGGQQGPTEDFEPISNEEINSYFDEQEGQVG